MGVFINGSNATSIQGSGDLAGFTFNFTYSNVRSGVSAGGTFSFAGTPEGSTRALQGAGFQSSFVDNLVNPAPEKRPPAPADAILTPEIGYSNTPVHIIPGSARDGKPRSFLLCFVKFCSGPTPICCET